MTQILDGLRQIAGIDGGGVVRQIATDTSGAVKLAADVTVDIGEVQILGADGATVLAVVAAEADGVANTLGAVRANAHGYVWNGATWDRQKSDGVTGAAAVGGSLASGAADSGNPVKVGGKYNATPGSLTDGNRGDLQVDQKGSLKVTVMSKDGTTSVDQIVQGDVADSAADSGNPVKVGAVVAAVGLGADLTAANRSNLFVFKRGGLLTTLADTASTNVARVLALADAIGNTNAGLVALACKSVFNGTSWDRDRSANSIDTGLSTGVPVNHEALEDDSAGTFTSVVAKGEYRNRVVSATNTANVVVVDLRNLHDTLSIHMAASASTATLVVEASADNANWIQADSITAAQFTVKVYGMTTAGAAAAAAAAGPIAPLAYRYVRITAGTAGVGNTTTLTIGAK